MKTLIAIPAMDMMHTPFVNSLLGLRRVGDVGVSITVSTLVHDARNRLAKQAVDEGYDRIYEASNKVDYNGFMYDNSIFNNRVRRR